MRDTVQIDWVAPFNGGFEIQGYKITILQSDGDTYTYELNGCDGTQTAVRDALSCTVLVSTLRQLPFSLEWGTSVYAKVIAYNFYGDSEVSAAGNGAVIITYPDAPLDVIEVVESRTPTSITIQWTEGFANGGSPVIDYRINYDEATAIYVVLAENHLTTTITASSLTSGLNYKFTVEARNEFGYSQLSAEVIILCAAKPDSPTTPTTTVVFDKVVLDWEAPNDNGTPITKYEVYIRKADLLYVVDATTCDGSDYDTIVITECTVLLN